MSHPVALSYIGAYSTCERPLDPMKVPFREGALAAPSQVSLLPSPAEPPAVDGRDLEAS